MTKDNGQLIQPTDAEQLQAVRSWQAVVNGMVGPRGGVPEMPDDPVASLLVEAAGMAIERGNRQRGVNILRMVARDFYESQEAALARAALDKLTPGQSR